MATHHGRSHGRPLTVAASKLAITTLAGVLLFTLLSPATPASGVDRAEDGTAFASSPAEGLTGTGIEVSGDGCVLPGTDVPGDGVVVTLVRNGVVAADETVPVEPDGSWQGSVTVPGGTAAGDYRVTAVCASPGFEERDPVTYAKRAFAVSGEGPGAPEGITTPPFNGGIEPFPDYDGQSTCSPNEKPGMAAFRRLVQSNYGGGSLGVSRACSVGGTSEHKEGRAWDWAMNAGSAADRGRVQDLFNWLFATDANCNSYANARRLGVMYIIWNRQMLRLYDTERGWTPYSGSSPHTDHVHFSLTRAGGAGSVSYYNRTYHAPAFLSSDRDIQGIDINANWQQNPTTGDFDGDGRDDLFWYRPGTETDHVWYSAGNGRFSDSTRQVGGNYRPFAGDFNGDCVDDVFLYGPGSARDHILLGTRGRSFLNLDVTVSGTYEPVVGDFNGDRASDIVWYRPGPGNDPVWYGSSYGRFVGRTVVADGNYEPIAGDFNGDGPDDIFWYGQGSAPDTLWRGTTNSRFTTASVNSDYVSDRPQAGDFNGDQRTDIFWYGAGAEGDAIWLGTANGGFLGSAVTMDGNFAFPATGDFDGNGQDDVLFHGDPAKQGRLWLFE